MALQIILLSTGESLDIQCEQNLYYISEPNVYEVPEACKKAVLRIAFLIYPL